MQKIYCFEPLEDSFKLLLKNLYLNNCENAECYNMGLSDDYGKTYFDWQRKDSLGASALKGNDMKFSFY